MQISHQFTLEVYKITYTFPKEELYGLTSQIRRSSASIPTNISEGCGRNSDAEFNQFLNIALGSSLETEYLLILSRDLNYIKIEDYNSLEIKINTIKSKIYNLKNKLTSQ